MTRLSEAALLGISMIAFWYKALRIPESQLPFAYIHIQLLPIYGVILFGAISTIIVLYRVFTFNNCEDANTELAQQIKDAKEDLQRKGFVFRSTKVDNKINN